MKVLYSLYRPFEQGLLKRSAAIVATSETYRASSESLSRFPEKCHVVPLGIDPRHYAPGQDGGTLSGSDSAAQGALRVLAIGRLTYYKGFEYLIEAIAKAKNAVLDLVGTGVEGDKLKKLAAGLGLDDKVVFHGELTDQEMIRHIAGCDCLCLPSIERTEAFGIVLLEAMLFGKATVISDVPGSGMGWIVEDGVTGIKVPPADADGLARALDALAGDRDELARMGRQGKIKFDQYFDIDRSVEKLFALYNRVLEQAGERSS